MKVFWKVVLAASILILGLGVAVFVQSGRTFEIATEEDLIADFEEVPCENEKRLEAVKNLFRKAGAVDTDLTVRDFGRGENLFVIKKGRSPDTVVIGAHYDKTESGCGAVDNWTGLVILANLYRTFKDIETEKTFQFVAFGEEEKGLVGSKALVGEIPESEIKKYCSMLNFDSFGFAPPQAMANTSDPDLIKLAEEVAREFDFTLASAEIDGANADSKPFNQKGIPAITFHGLTNNWKDYLHSESDEIKNIKSRSVYLGYRFGLSLLAKIDAAQCDAFR